MSGSGKVDPNCNGSEFSPSLVTPAGGWDAQCQAPGLNLIIYIAEGTCTEKGLTEAISQYGTRGITRLFCTILTAVDEEPDPSCSSRP